MSRDVCRFFNLGKCRYGENCFNLHINQRESHSFSNLSWYSNQNPNRNYSSNNSRIDILESHHQFNFRTFREPNENVLSSSNIQKTDFDLENEKERQVFNMDEKKICTICRKASLNSFDKKQENDFSKFQDKTCSICYDNILSDSTTRRFGILSSCFHTFCLECITTWRKQNYGSQIIRSCPECRIDSDFVYPSNQWIEDPQEKKQLMENYKNECAKKRCKYFRKGGGRCPFGSKCIYLHSLPNGTTKNVGSPRPPQQSTDELYLNDNEVNAFAYVLGILNRGQFVDGDSEDSSTLEYISEEDELITQFYEDDYNPSFSYSETENYDSDMYF